MKNNLSRFILLFSDFCVIALSIVLAFYTRMGLNDYFNVLFNDSVLHYMLDLKLYALVLSIFFYEGLYSKRFDFWHESRKIVKGIIFALLILLSFFALSKTMQGYSRFIIVIAFAYMAVLIPLSKYILKKSLYNLGLWKRGAKVYGDDEFLKSEIFNNHYLGYIETKEKNVKTVFINAKSLSLEQLKASIDKQMETKEEVIFIPFFNDYDLAQTSIYQLTNTRKNLIILRNKLKSKTRRFFQMSFSYILALLILPLIAHILAIIAYRIKNEEPRGSIFFKQERMGQDEKTFLCYKFRSMREDSAEVLQEYLKNNPDEIENYRIYHKYENDPRITKIGNFIRRTSLDELPQIINVLKGDMSLIGPRPYMLNEKEKIGSRLRDVLAVKPGISGLWQVSGRSQLDFHARVDLDVYYTKNWSLWLDLVILVKTVKVVLFREGAY